MEMGLVPWVPLTWAQLDPSPAWLCSSPVPWVILQGDEPWHLSVLARWPGRTRAQQGKRGRKREERTHLFSCTGGDHAVGRVLRGVPSQVKVAK